MSTDNLTLEERATNFETQKHINKVRELLDIIIVKLLERGRKHDASKLESPEVELFVKYTPKLAETTYGSPEYEDALRGLKPALDHHYANNLHHPNAHKNGINDMNLVDILEMFADWKAATLRQKDGNLRKSVEVNANKYGIAPQLVKIFENSISLFDQ